MADLSGAEVFKQVRAKKLKKSAEQVLFERAVGAAWLAHQRGFPVEAQTIYEQDRSLNVSVLQGLLGTEKFQNALVERGIPLETPIGVTAEQLYALSVMTDQSLGLDPFARLKRLGVSWAVWQGWLKQPLFARLYSKHAEDMLRSSIPAALTALSSRAQAGDNNSIKFLLAVTGYYDPAARYRGTCRSIEAAC